MERSCTNPSNIRVSLGNQKSFRANSAGNGGCGNPIPMQQQFRTQNYQQPNNYGGHYSSFGAGNYQHTIDTNKTTWVLVVFKILLVPVEKLVSAHKYF
ncbi:unnamed protein product [Orchesella dallaii]|uniref:Uncharacterized protein n=1 Tax=Orchesella dallaii TaxID=48710 RepID=A0ABP1QLZ7_9HEXA